MLLMLLFWYPVLYLILAICVFVLAMVADSTLNAKYITIYKGICRVMNKYRKQQRQNYLVFYQVLHRTNKALDRKHNKQSPQHGMDFFLPTLPKPSPDQPKLAYILILIFIYIYN